MNKFVVTKFHNGIRLYGYISDCSEPSWAFSLDNTRMYLELTEHERILNLATPRKLHVFESTIGKIWYPTNIPQLPKPQYISITQTSFKFN